MVSFVVSQGWEGAWNTLLMNTRELTWEKEMFSIRGQWSSTVNVNTVNILVYCLASCYMILTLLYSKYFIKWKKKIVPSSKTFSISATSLVRTPAAEQTILTYVHTQRKEKKNILKHMYYNVRV